MKGPLARLEELVLGPLQPNIEDLVLLAYGGGESRQERLKELVEWRQERSLMVAKGIIGTTAGFFLSLLLSALKSELHISHLFFAGSVAGTIGIGLSGLYVLARARWIPAEYAKLLAQLEALS